MKSFIRKFIPGVIFRFYHYILARLAALAYNYPSRKLIIVGITGTGGKSSAVFLLSRLLEKAGWKVGATSTVFFKVGEWEKLNDKKMTMLGRWQTQKMLRRMVEAGCQVAIIETTSQGIEQYRHLDIDYDVVVLTNLYPEHIEAHGGFENYKKAKGKLFATLSQTKKKKFGPAKTIIVNNDDENAEYFLSFPAQRKITFGLEENHFINIDNIKAQEISVTGEGISYEVEGLRFNFSLLGKLNVYNTLCALTIAKVLGLNWLEMQKAAEVMKNIPGRQEFIEEDQNFKVIVDYAYEPKAMSSLYEITKMIYHQKIIHVLGSAGGGRDVARRKELGKIAGANANYVIITDEDPYDDDPMLIINQVADGSLEAGKKEGTDLFKILDRREAIKKAISLAQKDDLAIITGKGSEQAICVKNGEKIPWDDRKVIREELASLVKKSPS